MSRPGIRDGYDRVTATAAPPEFWQAEPGDVVDAPFWPDPVQVQAVVQLDERFSRCHWTAAGASGVSVISEHALITFTRRRGPAATRHVPREVPAAVAVFEAARRQRLAGIARVRDDLPALLTEQGANADLAAMSRGQNLTPQPCGCFR